MEERELTQLLQRVADQVTPGPAPVGRIKARGSAQRRRRSGRVRVFAVAAAAAAIVGGGSVAAVVLDLPTGGGDTQSAAGEAADDAGGGGGAESGGGFESAPQAEGGGETLGENATTADRDAALTVTPNVVAPGETVEVASRDDEAMFGPPWRLERRTADGWSSEYTLVAAVGAGGPTWAPAEEELILEQPLIPAPVTVVIPPVTEPGRYRICQTDPGGTDRCGSITVTD